MSLIQLEQSSRFDQQISRRATGSKKWDLRPDLEPYWLADMDFLSPDCVIEELKARVEFGVFGYAVPHAGLIEAVCDYLLRQHSVSIEPKWLSHISGCVPALSLATRAFAKKGAMMTCTPVYGPFLNVHLDAQAQLITVKHLWQNERWEFDWAAMEKSVTPETRLFILCNPQNPLGRVFSQQEVVQVAEFCARHDLVLLSDEIHCDLILNESCRHFSALALPEELRRRTVTLMAPSKTYNVAGLGYSFAVIPDAGLHAKFEATRGCTSSEINCLGYYAAEAAYRNGEAWRRELIGYLRENRDLLYSFTENNLKGMTLRPMEATYLAWFDCEGLGQKNPQHYFEQQSGMFLNPGSVFGDEKNQSVRFNFGTSRAFMLNGLEKLAAVLSK